MENKTKKKPGCLIVGVIIIGIFFTFGLIGYIAKNASSTTSKGDVVSTNSLKSHEDLYKEAQELLNSGKFLKAIETIDKAIEIKSDEKYNKLKNDALAKVKERKEKLEASFEIEDDKVENIKFISPSKPIKNGLVFYPYIGIKNSEKYMLLRVGYQEKAANTLFVFTNIKVRAGEDLEEIKFSALDKINNVDILGTGNTELVDVKMDGDIQKLLETKIPNNKEIIVRFVDISNKSKDYTLSDKQKKDIANILEYYSYLENKE
jgi:hypothetical protein